MAFVDTFLWTLQQPFTHLTRLRASVKYVKVLECVSEPYCLKQWFSNCGRVRRVQVMILVNFIQGLGLNQDSVLAILQKIIALTEKNDFKVL